MDLAPLFRSMAEQDTAPIVICDLNHRIVYMNPTAVNAYRDRGGASLLGQNILDCHGADSRRRLTQVVDWFRADRSHNRVYIAHRPAHNRDQYMIALRDADGTLLGYYEKHEYRSPETAPLYDMPG